MRAGEFIWDVPPKAKRPTYECGGHLINWRDLFIFWVCQWSSLKFHSDPKLDIVQSERQKEEILYLSYVRYDQFPVTLSLSPSYFTLHEVRHSDCVTVKIFQITGELFRSLTCQRYNKWITQRAWRNSIFGHLPTCRVYTQRTQNTCFRFQMTLGVYELQAGPVLIFSTLTCPLYVYWSVSHSEAFCPYSSFSIHFGVI